MKSFLLTLALLPLLVAGQGVDVNGEPLRNSTRFGEVDGEKSTIADVFNAANTNVYTKGETDARIVELAPVPGNYNVVSNRAMNAVQANTNKTVIIETGNVNRPDSNAIGSFAHGELVVVNNGKGVYAGGVVVGALGDGAHAEGIGSQAYEKGAHAEGYNTKAYGYEAHAEGGFTRADGEASHAEGFHSSAGGDAAHAAGVRSTATDHASFVWQGTAVDGTRYSTIPLYGSHGVGTFNINPVGGLSGFWIGNMNMSQHILAGVSSVVTKGYVEGLGISSAEEDPVWEREKSNYASKNDVSDIAKAFETNVVRAVITNRVYNLTPDYELHVVWKKVASNGAFYERCYTNDTSIVEVLP